jgi:hypothetical protein
VDRVYVLCRDVSVAWKRTEMLVQWVGVTDIHMQLHICVCAPVCMCACVACAGVCARGCMRARVVQVP